MFETHMQGRYRRNFLAEVICQFRFPEILDISANPPAAFQNQIRDIFPEYQRRQELQPQLPGAVQVAPQLPIINHQFSTEDGIWRVNLTGRFISLTCSQYSSWEDFAAKLDQPLAAFIQIYHPAHFERIGLRYLNFISRKTLGLEDLPFSELIAPCYLGPLAEADVSEAAVSRCSIDVDVALRGGCRAKIHSGPGLTKQGGKSDTEVKFIFDQDLYMSGKTPVPYTAGALQTLHAQALTIFRNSITQTLHDAMMS